MSKYNIFPKPLKGGQTSFPLILDETNSSNILDLINSGLELNNVTITGGTIDGVIIGGNNPVDAYFTNISVSNNSNLNNILFPSGSSITEIGGDLILNASSNSNSVVINNPLEVNDDTIIQGDLTVIGNINNIPATPPLGMTIERLVTPIGNTVNVSNLYNISFLIFTNTVNTISTGTLNVSSIDGFYKIITILGIPSGKEYHLTINNLLDPYSQVSSNKLIKFKYSGQGIILIYSLTDNSYVLLPGGSV